MKWFITAFIGIFFTNTLSAQNLVPNGSFETLIDCPFTSTATNPPGWPFIWAFPWQSPTSATPDLYSSCPYNNTYNMPNLENSVPKNV